MSGIMDNEKNFDAEEKEFWKNKINQVVDCAKKKFADAYYAEDKENALEIVKNIILKFDKELESGVRTLGVGDSLSVHQIGAFDYLYEKKDLEIINPFERLDDGRFSEFKDYPNEWLPAEIYNQINRRVWEKARRALLSDVFITGANAITYDGTIISTDGTGNRLAGVLYGPYKVILVIGRNKIVKDNEAAFDRIKNIAAPMNHYRHFVKHRIQGKTAEENYGIYKFGKLPCVKYGKCTECNAPLCTRHATMILEKDTGGAAFKNRIYLIIVNDDLGC